MKGKIRIIAKFHRTDLVICSHSRERKPPSYSRRNTVLNVLSQIVGLVIYAWHFHFTQKHFTITSHVPRF